MITRTHTMLKLFLIFWSYTSCLTSLQSRDLGVTGAGPFRSRRRSVRRVSMCPRSHWSRQETFRQAPPVCYTKGTRSLSAEEVLRNKRHPLKSSGSVTSDLAAPAENDSPRVRFHNRARPTHNSGQRFIPNDKWQINERSEECTTQPKAIRDGKQNVNVHSVP